MTTVQTRIHQIAGVEKFVIAVKRDGAPVDPRTNGLMGPYSAKRALKRGATVADWKTGRFFPDYPGLDCDVLYEDGTVAPGQTLIATVRASYGEG